MIREVYRDGVPPAFFRGSLAASLPTESPVRGELTAESQTTAAAAAAIRSLRELTFAGRGI